MSSPEQALRTVQEAFGPHVKPREEVAHIRRVLALHLQSCLKDAKAADGPLGLVVPTESVSSSLARGLHREYLEALNANKRARDEAEACAQETPRTRGEPAFSPDQGFDRLQNYLVGICLREKQERLQAVDKYLDLLGEKPVASPDFLLPENVFAGSKELPEVPEELIRALALEKPSASTQLADLIDQLEKHVLRTKLLLKREERLLEQVKARSSTRPESISDSAKLEALNATRTELINWMETELSKVSEAGEGDGAHESSGQRTGSERLDQQLASIKNKYTRYLESRKLLLELVTQQVKPVIKPQNPPSTQPTVSPPAPPPLAHLLSPYFKELLSVAREQKGLIVQKSHLNTAVTRQLKENAHGLERLAEESQLIPSHPMPSGVRQTTTFGDAVTSAVSLPLSATNRVMPWVFAAESAKITTLENVAEKIEEGQVALEVSAKTVSEIDQLLGRNLISEGRDKGGDGRVDDDIWLAEGADARKSHENKKHTARKGSKSSPSRDTWDMVDGNVGLLQSDADPT